MVTLRSGLEASSPAKVPVSTVKAHEGIPSPLASLLVAASASSGSSTSSEDQDSDSESDNSSSDDSETEDDSEARREEEVRAAGLKQLFLKAKADAKARSTAAQQNKSKDNLAEQDELILFGDNEEDDEEDEQRRRRNPVQGSSRRPAYQNLGKPVSLKAPTSDNPVSTSATFLSRISIGKSDDGNRETLQKSRSGGITLGQDLAGFIEGGKGEKWGRTPLAHLTKKERKARQVPTAGPKWFDLPAPTMTPELKREVQAMRLRNALDPKRFYKGSATKEDKKMPEFFQVGHIVSSDQSASTASPSAIRKRTFIEELVDDEQAKSYAKKKFVNEVMVRGMSGRNKFKKGKKRQQR